MATVYGENVKFKFADEKGIVSAEQLAEIEKRVNDEINWFNHSDDGHKEISIRIYRTPDANATVTITSFSEINL